VFNLLPLVLQLSLPFKLFLTIGFSHLHYRLRFELLFFPLGENFISSARVAFRTIERPSGPLRTDKLALLVEAMRFTTSVIE
jgi:hypothetical protein